jgi:hypothetical protein
MNHDFKKGDYVILPDGKTGTIHSIVVGIVEVEINKHYKYVDVRTLKHFTKHDVLCCNCGQRQGDHIGKPLGIPYKCYEYLPPKDPPGFEGAMLRFGWDGPPEPREPENNEWVKSLFYEDPFFKIPDKESRASEAVAELETLPFHDQVLHKFIADGCDLEPIVPCQPGCPADDGPEVEILRSKP